jgi:uncharacterized protein (DUF362 family)
MSLVSFKNVENLQIDAIKKAIDQSLNLINFDFGKKVSCVIIKPNMCYYIHPSTGDVTYPLLISALIDVLRENFSSPLEIFIVESDASAMKCKYAFRFLGYDKLAEEKRVRLVNLSELETRTERITINSVDLQFSIPTIFDKADLIINVPKIKYMKGSVITCSLKNIFGCNAFAKKFVYHKTIHEAIVGINKLIKTDLVIVDGLFVCGRNTKQMNMVMASKDPVAMDAACAKMLGLNPKSVKHIVLASNEGLGKTEFVRVGNYSFFKNMYPVKTFKDKVRGFAVSIYLRLLK